jgi:hypothetical protein
MAEIKVADLLKLQQTVTKTVQHEVREARKEFRAEFAGLRGEVTDLRSAHIRLDERSKLTPRGLFSSLSNKQKAAVWSAAIAGGGVVLDGLRHVVAMLFALWVKGVHP